MMREESSHAGRVGVVRDATPEDVSQMVDLSAARRRRYAEHQPTFWRPAADADARQREYFESLLARETVVARVCEREGQLDGFAIAALVGAPPVYDPGGLTCLIDDFAVRADDLWETAGQALLSTLMQDAKDRGAVQTVLVCGHLDEPKRKMFRALGHTIASEWWVCDLGSLRTA